MTDQDPMPTRDSFAPSHTYKVSLAAAVLLFFATLTIAVIAIIIANARERNREEEFDSTLTAVWQRIDATQTALAITPTPGPAVVYGEYAFTLAPESPAYGAGDTCDVQVVAGRVQDQQGQPIDGFSVLVWGDYTPAQTVQTGELTGEPRGYWALTLAPDVRRRVWVQLTGENRFFSAPVEIIFDNPGCDHNRVEIVFQQIAPLE